jgi:streptogramin lyase
MRVVIAVGLCLVSAGVFRAATNGDKTNRSNSKAAHAAAPKTGIKTPGIQIPFDSLKFETEVAVETPGWITTGDSVFVSNRSKDSLIRIEAKTNKILDRVSDLKEPCSGSVVAFGSLWIPNCGTQALTRFDPKANKVIATLTPGVADVPIGIAATTDSIWMMTDSKTTLSRIDPGENQVTGEVRLAANCNSVSFGEGSLWVTCPAESHLLRINPATNLVEKRIEISAGGRSVAFGANSVWVLCEKEGKVERIDPKTNKVVKTIELGVPNARGNLAFGDGFVWVTQDGFPLTRIDPEAEKERVAQQFWGEGGGLISVTNGVIWLSNVNKGTVWRLDPKRVIATIAE